MSYRFMESQTLLNGSIVIAIAAAAETFILISGGFDLSVAGISGAHQYNYRGQRRIVGLWRIF